LNNSNLATITQTSECSILKWNYIVNEAASVFRLTDSEKETLNNSTTAKIIATIPFAAKCINAERTAIAHIGLYLMEKRGFQQYCAHLPEDDSDIFKRLAFISTFEGGNAKIIRHGMNMLALIMIEGYKQSAKKDLRNGIYNPIANGKWNHRKIKNELLEQLSEIECPMLDELFFVTATSIPSPGGKW